MAFVQRSQSAFEGETFPMRRATQSPPVLLFYHPSMAFLAEKIAKTVDSRILTEDSQQEVRLVVLSKNIRWDRFRDGWPNIFIDEVEKIAGRDVILLVSFHSPEVIFEQLSLMYSLPRYLVKSFRVILPYFPTGTMERVDTEGQIVTAKILANLLSAIPLASRGPSQIIVFDIHALQERFYFSDQVIPRLLSVVPYLVKVVKKLPLSSNLAVAFPDEGAHKRFHSFIEEWPMITCIKVREGDKRIVKVKEGDPSGKHVLIVDDLVQTGGTLIQCAKVLMASGATAISLFVTHGVFPNKSWKRFTHEEGEIEFANFWISDSIPHSIEICNHKPFQLLSLSEAIMDSLLAYDLLRSTQ